MIAPKPAAKARKDPSKATKKSKSAASKSSRTPKSGVVLAYNLKLERQRQEMTIKELAQAAGLTVNYVGSLERQEGDVNISVFNLEKLANVLNVQVFQLLVPPVDS